MRAVHRLVAILAVFLGLYVAATGLGIQLTDLVTLLGHRTGPNLEAMREGADGPANFQVRTEADDRAAPLPAGFNFDDALTKVVEAGRAGTHGAPFNFVEFRMVDGRPVGQIASHGRLLRFDATSGAVLIGPGEARKVLLPPAGGQPALRNTFKTFHRWTAYGDVGQLSFPLVALILCVMVFTGIVLYVRLLVARARLGRSNPFWSAGGWWRTAHRIVAVAASVFVTVQVVTGAMLACNSAGVDIFRLSHHGSRPGLTADVSKPLTDAELPAMLDATLAAERSAGPDRPIKVLRLRYFAGHPQGVVVEGGPQTRQRAFDTATGRTAPLYAEGYPQTGQPFGWQWTQTVKGIHRGDAFGPLGRWVNLLTGLALLFLCISGGVNYFELWNRRRQAGRHGLFWP